MTGILVDNLIYLLFVIILFIYFIYIIHLLFYLLFISINCGYGLYFDDR